MYKQSNTYNGSAACQGTLEGFSQPLMHCMTFCITCVAPKHQITRLYMHISLRVLEARLYSSFCSWWGQLMADHGSKSMHRKLNERKKTSFAAACGSVDFWSSNTAEQ